MFIGVDHGTQAVRFATLDKRKLELPRENIAELSVVHDIEEGLNLKLEFVKLIGLTYSMGDGITKITDIRKVRNRGLKAVGGAGRYVGGGTAVYDAIRASNTRAIVLPGIHDESNVDSRMKFFSHGASPEKVGLAYYICKYHNSQDFILCDTSSNTVSLAVAESRILGAIDAAIFAPGVTQGPLDLQAIRDVDSGLMTANEAFSRGGLLKRDLNDRAVIATLALYVSMEINALQVLLRDYSAEGDIYLAGAAAVEVKGLVDEHLTTSCTVLDPWSAATGCAAIAKDVWDGATDIMGIPVDFSPPR
ncbi:MAG TPA: methanogenesis marker 12 protein [Candidatus Bathyarchaeia archaeon]|nr:methanogenesis marker 12 protein [Candidatus Bathyarchaeia archaeon]